MTPPPIHCLWVTRQDPRPADSGELIYSLGLLDSLAATNAAGLTVLSHRTEKQALRETAGVRWELHGHIPEKQLRCLLSPLPADAFRLGNPLQRRALRSLLAQHDFDWVLIDQAACAWALGEIPAGMKVAYIAHNHEASVRREVAADRSNSLPARAALSYDSARYARMERDLCRRAGLITAITPRDASLFQSEFPGKTILVLPPGYSGGIPSAAPAPLDATTPRKVVLAGAFEWLAKRRNLETFLAAAARVFPAAGIDFQIVGKGDPEWFSNLSKQHPWARFDANVPDISPFLRDARIGLIPEALGGGFKLKALDYIFRGLPLAAIRPALSGVPVDPVTDAIVADDPADLASAVAAKIDDLGFLNAAARRALEQCRGAFDWSSRGHELARALAEPLSPSP